MPTDRRCFHQLKNSWVLFCQVLCSFVRYNLKSLHRRFRLNFHRFSICLFFLLTLSLSTSYWGPFPFLLRGQPLKKCNPTADSPILLNLKTKMRVFYDGGQWYHMAENYLVQHSLLSNQNRLIDGKYVWYNFDKDYFAGTMNSFTRLIVYLGTVAPNNDIRTISFIDSYPLLRNIHRSSQFKVGDGVLLRNDILETSQTFRVGPAIDPTIRFSKLKGKNSQEQQLLHDFTLYEGKSSTLISSISPVTLSEQTVASSSTIAEQDICFRYMGDVGGQIINRNKWFPTEDNIISFREKLRNACPQNDGLIHKFKKKKTFKLVVYQRDFSRQLINQAEVILELEEYLRSSSWQITVVEHDNDRSPCELSHILHDADVLLTPHGFQSTLLLFLPSPALIFEIFPYPYYKPPYKLLAESVGVVHASFFSPPISPFFRFLQIYFHLDSRTCNKFYICRDLARRQNVMLKKDGVQYLLDAIRNYQPLFQTYPAYRNCTFPSDQSLRYQPQTAKSIRKLGTLLSLLATID